MTQYKRRLGLTVNKTLYEKLKSLAEYQGKTINATCLDIFWYYFEQISNKQPSSGGEGGDHERRWTDDNQTI